MRAPQRRYHRATSTCPVGTIAPRPTTSRPSQRLPSAQGQPEPDPLIHERLTTRAEPCLLAWWKIRSLRSFLSSFITTRGERLTAGRAVSSSTWSASLPACPTHRSCKHTHTHTHSSPLTRVLTWAWLAYLASLPTAHARPHLGLTGISSLPPYRSRASSLGLDWQPLEPQRTARRPSRRFSAAGRSRRPRRWGLCGVNGVGRVVLGRLPQTVNLHQYLGRPRPRRASAAAACAAR